MKLGLHLPSGQPGANASDIVHVTARAEGLGFDAVWMFDHLFTPAGLESSYPYTRDGDYPLSADDPFFEPLGLLGVLAGATSTIGLGTSVLIAAYRHPIQLAKTIASIERFAPGRIVLGLGAGWMREEFDALGIPFERRGARLEEYVAALRAVWNGRSAFDGEFYSWAEAGFHPTPSRPVPILLGGHADAALARAARVGDGWVIATARGQGSGVEAVSRRIEFIRSRLEIEGRDGTTFDLVYQTALWFSDHPNEKLPLTGPPEHIAESIERLRGVGVTAIDLAVFGPGSVVVETAERFAADVRPLVARTS